MKLLCLPYAGGSAQIYKSKFERYLDDTIQIIPIELPGRGIRFGENLKWTFKDLLQDLLLQIYNVIYNDTEYALFGYSMGSLMIYELYYEIIERKWKKPKMLFFCAANPPEIKYKSKKKDKLSIVREMKRLGGTADQVLENKELLDIFVPIMRADFQVLESYHYKIAKEKIDVPIIVQYGYYDKEVKTNIKMWENYTISECTFFAYDEGHFFINKYYKEMAYVINRKLQE